MVDTELDFERSGYEKNIVSRDLAFGYKDDKASFVSPSGTEQRLAVVNIPEARVSKDTIDISYITFNEEEFLPGRAPDGLYRCIEWPAGTDYVWVNNDTLNYLDIVNIADGETKT